MIDTMTVITEEPLREPWEKQIGETGRAFAAFKSYRDLPATSRSLKKAVVAVYGEGRITAKIRQYQEWSAKNNWVARVMAWDEEVDRKAREDLIAQTKEMNARHIKVAQAIQQQAIKRLTELVPQELSPTDILSFLTNGTRMERLARGEPEKVESHSATLEIIDYSKLPPEELQKILLKRIATLPTTSIVSEVDEEQ